jgi:flagellar hook-associated protein 2
MAIRLGGLSSGLDTEALVAQLMQLERAPLYALKSRTTYMQSQKNDLSGIKSALNAFQYSIKDLTYSSAFLGRIAKTTDDKVVTATAKNSSSNASYVVDVTKMATASKVTGAELTGFDTGTAAKMEGLDLGGLVANDVLTGITPGSFTINNTKIDVTATDTLNTVLNKITASAAGVKAEIVGNKVVLTQKIIGATPTITLGTPDSTGFLAKAKIDAAPLTVGQDAEENRVLAGTDLGAALDPVTGSGYFSINGAFIFVDKNTDTLSSVIAKINNSPTAGVTAMYDQNTKKVYLTSKTLGDDPITLGTNPGTDSSNFLTTLGLTTSVAGEDAEATVNGIAVAATDNAVTVNDVTFTLKSVGKATVSVQNDADGAVSKVKSFIEKYNAAIDAIKAELTEEKVKDAKTDADKIQGNLRGDYLLNSVQSNLRSFVYKTVSSLPSSMNQFSQIGISTGKAGSGVESAKTGHLVLDEEKLRNALASDAQAVANLFGHGTESAVNEEYTSDGSTTFTLKKFPVAAVPAPTLEVNGTSYTLVSGPPSTTEADHQYSINYTTGEITFGYAPMLNDTIKVSYDYGGSVEGLAVQMKNVLGELTRVGGSFENRIGSNGSLAKSMKATEASIESMERRLALREKTLYKQFATMESLMSNMKSQQSWLNSQLAGLGSWSE